MMLGLLFVSVRLSIYPMGHHFFFQNSKKKAMHIVIGAVDMKFIPNNIILNYGGQI